jgi:hypothetical protein
MNTSYVLGSVIMNAMPMPQGQMPTGNPAGPGAPVSGGAGAGGSPQMSQAQVTQLVKEALSQLSQICQQYGLNLQDMLQSASGPSNPPPPPA